MGAVQPFCRQCNDYSGLGEAVRDRTEQMELSRLELDHIAGLTAGHTDKIISPRAKKRFGITSLGAILQTLGLILLVVEDPVARDKTLARRFQRQQPLHGQYKPSRIEAADRKSGAGQNRTRATQTRAGFAVALACSPVPQRREVVRRHAVRAPLPLESGRTCGGGKQVTRAKRTG